MERWKGGKVERWKGGRVERWKGGKVESWKGGIVAGWKGALIACLALVGCSMERHYLSNPGTSQTVRVESGDRLFMDLDEEADEGYRWRATCNDPDVEVRIVHEPGTADVTIRIHRGYDGPSAVTFAYGRGSEKPTKTFTVTLFKRTGDCAFWE